MRRGLILLMLFLVLPLFGKQKKPSGEVLDEPSFRSIHSFCVDTSGLFQTEADAVKRFVKNQSKPRGLLNQLPWKLQLDCNGVDAAVAPEFHEQSDVAQATEGGQSLGTAVGTGGSVTETFFQVLLQVKAKASGKPAYRLLGPRAVNSREEALEKAFKSLGKDLKLGS